MHIFNQILNKMVLNFDVSTEPKFQKEHCFQLMRVS